MLILFDLRVRFCLTTTASRSVSDSWHFIGRRGQPTWPAALSAGIQTASSAARRVIVPPPPPSTRLRDGKKVSLAVVDIELHGSDQVLPALSPDGWVEGQHDLDGAYRATALREQL